MKKAISKDEQSMLIVLGLIGMLFLLRSGFIPGVNSIFIEGTKCTIPSGGGECVYTYKLPQNMVATDGALGIGFKSIESAPRQADSSNIIQGEYLVTMSEDDCLGAIPCLYNGNNGREGSGSVEMESVYSINSITEPIISTYINGSLVGRLSLNSREVVADNTGHVMFTIIVGSQSYSWRLQATNDNYEECVYSISTPLTNGLVNQYVHQSLNGCVQDVDIDIPLNNIQFSSAPKIILKFEVNDGSNGAITQYPSFESSKWSYTTRENISSYSFKVKEIVIESDSPVTSEVMDTISFPNTLNLVCSRSTSNAECLVPITFSASSGGEIYILEKFIELQNQDVPPIQNNTTKNNTIFCPKDIYTCEDGTTVNRVPPSCAFAPCPKVDCGVMCQIFAGQNIYIIGALSTIVVGAYLYKRMKGGKK